MKKIWVNSLIVIAMGVVLVILMFFTDGLDQLVLMLKSMNYLWLLASFGCMILYWIFGSLTIDMLKRGVLGKEKYVRHTFKTLMIGQFFSAVTPFSTGGQPAQIYFMVKQKVDAGKAASIVILKSVLNMVVLFTISFVFFFLKRQSLTAQIPNFIVLFIIGCFANFLLIVLYFLFLLNKDISENIIIAFLKFVALFKKKEQRHVQEQFDKINDSLISFQEGFLIIMKRKFHLIAGFFFQCCQLLSIFSVPVFLIRSIEGQFFDPLSVIAATGLLMMITSLVPTPGTTGGAEGLGVYFLGRFFPNSPILSVILIWRIITYYSTILFGGIFTILNLGKAFNDIEGNMEGNTRKKEETK